MVNRRRLVALIGVLSLSILLLGAAVTRHSLTREDLNLVNPLDFASALTDATLTLAINDIGSNNRALMITPGTWTIAANLTIPASEAMGEGVDGR